MEVYRGNIGGKEFMISTKSIVQADLTEECWFVQVWGLPYCSGFGDPANKCECLGTEECGGYRIRGLIMKGKYPKNGLPEMDIG